MNELATCFGVASLGGVLGGIVTHLASRLLDHRLQKAVEDYKRSHQEEVEGYKHTLAVLATRLDFLHQERGKASLTLVRLLKTAKMHVKLLVGPMQLGPVDQEQACRDAHAACTEVHNLIAETSFLFPKPVEEQMMKVRSVLWSILDEATLLFREAKRKGESPFDNPVFGELWRRLRAEFGPLEVAMIAEVRSLLGASPGEDPTSDSQDGSDTSQTEAGKG